MADASKSPIPSADAIRDQMISACLVDIKRELGDLGQYSYAALCSYVFYRLYENSEQDRKFVKNWVERLEKKMDKGQAFLNTMLALASGEVELQDASPLISSLHNDPRLQGDAILLLPQDFVGMVITDGCYDARLRSAARMLCLLLNVDWAAVEVYEDSIVMSLREEVHVMTEEEEKEKEKASSRRKFKRFALIGVAAVGGGALLGLTGGLAAPLIAAGAGAVIGTAGAAALGSVAGVAVIGSLFGVAGAGLGGYKMQKRVGGVEQFEFEPLTEAHQLHLTIAVSGWITDKCPDFRQAWQGLANSKEQYVLRYESKYMQELGQALDYLVGMAVNMATQEALKYTVLSGLLSAIIWPATLLGAASIIDNPWNVCTVRAVGVGRQLAEVLLSRQQGKRPVTLIGFSLGARVIFCCLQELAKRKNSQGIVENVVLLGAPVPGNASEWEPLGKVVAGHIINGFCRGDWLLKFLYRTASAQLSIAGLAPVEWKNRRMNNIDLSQVVNGHMDYLTKIDTILEVVGVGTKPHATKGEPASLQQWVSIQRSSTHSKISTETAAEACVSAKLSVSDSELVRISKEKKEDEIPETMPSDEKIPGTMPSDEKIPGTMPSDGDIPGTMPSDGDVPGTMPSDGDIPRIGGKMSELGLGKGIEESLSGTSLTLDEGSVSISWGELVSQTDDKCSPADSDMLSPSDNEGMLQHNETSQGSAVDVKLQSVAISDDVESSTKCQDDSLTEDTQIPTSESQMHVLASDGQLTSDRADMLLDEVGTERGLSTSELTVPEGMMSPEDGASVCDSVVSTEECYVPSPPTETSDSGCEDGSVMSAD